MRTLNCKRVARMISLYVAGDLAGAPEREVAGHLAACEQCRRRRDEFAESSSLLTQAFTPPEFGAEFYSGIRSAVLGEIRRDRMAAKPSLFRRHWLSATAFAAVVMASSVMLQHFVSASQTEQGLAGASWVKGQPTSRQAKETDAPSFPQLSGLQLPRKWQGSRAPSNKALALVNARRNSRPLEIVRKPDASAASQPAQAMLSTSKRASESQVSRIEIQTADPNIRIIWLAPQESRDSADNHDRDQDDN